MWRDRSLARLAAAAHRSLGPAVNGVQSSGDAWILESTGAGPESAWLEAMLPFDTARQLELFPFPHRVTRDLKGRLAADARRDERWGKHRRGAGFAGRGARGPSRRDSLTPRSSERTPTRASRPPVRQQPRFTIQTQMPPAQRRTDEYARFSLLFRNPLRRDRDVHPRPRPRHVAGKSTVALPAVGPAAGALCRSFHEIA